MEEAQDLLSELESALLELEDQPEDSELVDRVFRAMHTIKGSGAMFGFDDIAAFTHDVENMFDRVRNNELKVTKEILSVTLSCRDHIAYLLQCAANNIAVDLAKGSLLTDRVKQFLGDETPGPAAPADSDESDEDLFASSSDRPSTYRIRFKPVSEIFMTGNNPLHLIEELGEMGSLTTYVHTAALPELASMQPESCYLWWDMLLHTTADEQAVRDVFMFVEDECDLAVQVIDRGDRIDSDAMYKRIGEILIERGDLKPEDLQRVLSQQRPVGKMLEEAGVVSADNVESALQEQKAVRDLQQKREPASEAASSIRVAANKLDYLVDLVGELVIVQSQIAQMVHEREDADMLSLSENLERLSDELRDATLGIRMLPIGTTFSKFRRLVRDLSGDLGKEVELVTFGAETELDKTVIERLGDPLVHCLRNSLDHGIESPELRESMGKPRKGTITLGAAHSGGEVLITIKDDGKGLDRDKLVAKAIERGVIAPDAELSDKEAFGLIFAAGFSTAEKVTSVSGRGVGMDVVRRSIEELRGTIELDSIPGQSTVITIRLPLTLAIIDGLQVQVGEESYVIPLAPVEECVEHFASNNSGKKQIINLREEVVPYISLRSLFDITGNTPEIEQIVVVNALGSRFGIVVDRVVGEHQTVIKSLGKVFKNVEGISGATIRGDGTMALILDLPRLVQTAISAN
ncbi:chemotaxis protein CheW [Oleidesulfovibrio sp.]|uniref:chemotaxis protein CheA n=1 Tax=Oleidesulfovibrio sp. TaxID=2909707 RepID=UPI003A8468BB